MHELFILLGIPATITAVAAGIVGLSVWLETISSREAKADLTRYIRTTDFSSLGAKLPVAVEYLFVKLFGEQHLSLKCVRRSVFVSLGGIVVSLLIGFVTHYSYFHTMPGVIVDKPGFRVMYFGFIVTSLLLDYFNLFKTRIIIRYATRRKISLVFVPIILAVDFFISYVIFAALYFLFDSFNMSYQLVSYKLMGNFEWFFVMALWIFKTSVLSDVFIHWRVLPHILSGPFSTEVSVLFYSGMLPSMWLWLHALSLIVMTIVIRSKVVIRGSIYFLDIEGHPIRSLGIFAAAVTSSLWILLIFLSRLI